MNRHLAVTWFLLCLAAPPAAAQTAAPDPMAQYLFPPELVMQHQQRIGLTPHQRTVITDALGKTQASILKLQWEIQTESERLIELVAASPVDEAAALAQVDRVLAVERQIKRQHLSLLIRIRNTLTKQQQTRLKSLREGESK